jgi:hypothetical protein
VGELEVGLAGDMPISWIDASTVPDAIRGWIAEEKSGLVAAAQDVERRRRQSATTRRAGTVGQPGIGMQGLTEMMARQQSAINHVSRAMENSGLLGEQDKRTIEEYVLEVDKWAEHRTHAALSVVQGKYISAGHGVVALTVRNPTGRFLPDVEVELISREITLSA